MSSNKGSQKSHRVRRREGGGTAYPISPKSVAERRDDEGRCPECGATEGCYACVTSGGWLSRKQHEENERHAAMERSP